MKDILIKKVETVEECLKCNSLLEDLIKYESKLDNQISENTKIENHYERTLGKDDSVIFVAMNGDEIIGYVMAYKQKENSVVKDNIIQVLNLFIKENYRKKSVGKSLMIEVEKWAKEKCTNFVIELECISNNYSALDFYKKLGYENIRIRLRKKF